MGRTHLLALKASDRVRVVAAAEPAESARRQLIDEVTVHSDVDSMLAAGSIDGVLVAAPSDIHLKLLRAILPSGLPILCEKPCGVRSEEAAEAARLADSHGALLQVAYWRRFVPALREARRAIESGSFGRLSFVASFQWDERAPATSFRERSGGILVDMGVHEFDQLRWLTGQEFEGLHAVASEVTYDPPVVGDPESVQVLATMSAGTTALISLGRRFPPGDMCMVRVFGTDRAEEHRFLWPPHGDDAFHDALRRQAEAFAEAARGAASAGASAHDAVAALAAAERARATLAGGGERA
jgi:myo-inositol 2-dehydrogenase/D-chiro-inositol 1-dehydrogenase